jgi:hypothetical protein
MSRDRAWTSKFRYASPCRDLLSNLRVGATMVSTPREQGKRFTSLEVRAPVGAPRRLRERSILLSIRPAHSRFTSPTTCQVDGNLEAYTVQRFPALQVLYFGMTVLAAAVGLRCTWLDSRPLRAHHSRLSSTVCVHFTGPLYG